MGSERLVLMNGRAMKDGNFGFVGSRQRNSGAQNLSFGMNQRLCNGPVDCYGRMDSEDSPNYMNCQNGRVDHLNAESNSMMRSNMGYNSEMGNIGVGDWKFSQNLPN